MYNKTNTPRPAQSFGAVQETFRYNLAKGFNNGDQFTIVEDMPKSKPIRTEIGEPMKTKDGRTFEPMSYLIRVVSKGYEADMLVYPKLLPGLAILCPKGLANFKGTTFIFDGYNWAFLGIEGTTNMRAAPDARQPNLSEPAPQEDFGLKNIRQMLADIKTVTKLGVSVKVDQVTKIADSIAPGKALDMIKRAKEEGFMYEKDGVYIVV
jgi:hypothetical protein